MSDQQHLPPSSTPLDTSMSSIQSWSLHFRGEYQFQAGAAAFEPALAVHSFYTAWEGASQEQTPNMPVLTVLENKVTVGELKPQPQDGRIEKSPPWVMFHNSGYLAEVNLDLSDTGGLENLQAIGSTENVSLRATLRNETEFGTTEFAHTEEGASIALRASSASVAKMITPPLPYNGLDGSVVSFDLSGIWDVRPIIYLEQDGGFILLAELVDEELNRRIMLSIYTGYAGGTQHWIVSRPYYILAPTEYTIRVHQDGDISQEMQDDEGRYHRYFEFWVNNLPLGIHELPSTTFPFKKGISKVGIGYWPRANGEALYFTGGISDIIVDPHEHCPGC